MTKPSPAQLESFGEELDAIRQRVIADLGEADAAYIRKVVKTQRSGDPDATGATEPALAA